MKAPYRVEARVIEQNGQCDFHHQVGDVVRFDGEDIEGRICWHALASMTYKIHGMLFGADFPWLKDKDIATHPCPDYKNPVVFELKRYKAEGRE